MKKLDHSVSRSTIAKTLKDNGIPPSAERSTSWKTFLNADASIEVVRTAIQDPDMNAIAERWVRSIKTRCLNKIIPFGFRTLERSVDEFVTHYNLERPHQGLGNELIAGSKDSGTGEVFVS